MKRKRDASPVAAVVGSSPMANICMTKGDAVREHTKLVRVLRTGSDKELKSEARDQAGELRGYRKKSNRVDSRR